MPVRTPLARFIAYCRHFANLHSLRTCVAASKRDASVTADLFRMLEMALQDPSAWPAPAELPKWMDAALLCLLEWPGLPTASLARICEWLHVLNPATLTTMMVPHAGGALDKKYFERAVQNLKRVLSVHLRGLSPEKLLECYSKREVLHVLRVLSRIKFLAGGVLPLAAFYCSELNESFAVLKQDFLWMRSFPEREERGGLWCFLDFGFLIDVRHKGDLLRFESAVRMRLEAQDSFFRAMFDGVQKTFLPVSVRRERMIEDALAQLEDVPGFELRRQLRVQFVGEEGVDQGGLRKEFFHLIMREIFDPRYGMFEYHAESQLFWFAPELAGRRDEDEACERLQEYFLVGLLVGLAIYNSVLIEMALPRALFKKILGKSLEFGDLEALSPTLARGLRHLIACDGVEFEETYGGHLMFACDVSCLSGVHTVELKRGGREIAVRHEDRIEYVRLYCGLILNELAEWQFQAFKRGLVEVVGESVLWQFEAEEMEQLVCGTCDLDLAQWQRVAKYEGYDTSSKVVEWFWQFAVHEADAEQRARLLFFVTGTRRAPVGGMADVPLTIMKNGTDDSKLPTSHTCFNFLLLPEYTDRDTLLRLLLKALENCEGFGLQ